MSNRMSRAAGVETVVGRVDKEHLALLKYVHGAAQEASREATNAAVAYRLTMGLVTEKFGLPENGQVDLQTGDVVVRETSPVSAGAGRNGAQETQKAPEDNEPIKLFP